MTDLTPNDGARDVMIEPLTDAEQITMLRETVVRLSRELTAIMHALHPKCPVDCPNRCDESMCDCGASDDMAGQVSALTAQIRAATVAECVGAAGAEPELPGEMPDEMWDLIRSDRDAAHEAYRIAVRMTKEGIANRLRALLPAPENAEKGA